MEKYRNMKYICRLPYYPLNIIHHELGDAHSKTELNPVIGCTHKELCPAVNLCDNCNFYPVTAGCIDFCLQTGLVYIRMKTGINGTKYLNYEKYLKSMEYDGNLFPKL